MCQPSSCARTNGAKSRKVALKNSGILWQNNDNLRGSGFLSGSRHCQVTLISPEVLKHRYSDCSSDLPKGKRRVTFVHDPNADIDATGASPISANPFAGYGLFAGSVAIQMTARSSTKHPVVAGFHAITSGRMRREAQFKQLANSGGSGWHTMLESEVVNRR